MKFKDLYGVIRNIPDTSIFVTYKVFARKTWKIPYYFTWCHEDGGYYAYCTIDEWGNIIFKPKTGHGVSHDRQFSSVGYGVLSATDIYEVDTRTTEPCNEVEKNLKGNEMKKIEVEVVVVDGKVDATPVETREVKWYGMFYNRQNELVDTMCFYSKKDAREELAGMDEAVSVELYRKAVILEKKIPIIETAV